MLLSSFLSLSSQHFCWKMGQWRSQLEWPETLHDTHQGFSPLVHMAVQCWSVQVPQMSLGALQLAAK